MDPSLTKWVFSYDKVRYLQLLTSCCNPQVTKVTGSTDAKLHSQKPRNKVIATMWTEIETISFTICLDLNLEIPQHSMPKATMKKPAAMKRPAAKQPTRPAAKQPAAKGPGAKTYNVEKWFCLQDLHISWWSKLCNFKMMSFYLCYMSFNFLIGEKIEPCLWGRYGSAE